MKSLCPALDMREVLENFPWAPGSCLVLGENGGSKSGVYEWKDKIQGDQNSRIFHVYTYNS